MIGQGESGGSTTYSDDWLIQDNVFNIEGAGRAMRFDSPVASDAGLTVRVLRNEMFTSSGRPTFSSGVVIDGLTLFVQDTPRDGLSWAAGQTELADGGVYTTALRPSASTAGAGFEIYDSTLKRPYWSDGTNWKAFGTVLGITALANDATPTVDGLSTFTTGGTTTITDFDDGVLGQTITILSEHAVTITDGTNIILNGSANFVMAAADSLTLVLKADNKWYETARMVN
jgi:hypothetical protein